MKTNIWLALAMLACAGSAVALEVQITSRIAQFQVPHGDKVITVLRDQDTGASIDPDYALTSRPCPPFCIQPMQAAEGVATIGDLELIDFMRTGLADGSTVLVDARTPKWHRRGTIPGSINIPFTHLNPAQGADEITLEDALALLGVSEKDGGWDFSRAKRVILWCNGPWCGQSPTAIRGMLSIGYPAQKLFYYRGGMQSWRGLGLPIVNPDGSPLE